MHVTDKRIFLRELDNHRWECTWTEDGDRSNRAGSVSLPLIKRYVVIILKMDMKMMMDNGYEDGGDDDENAGPDLAWR